MNMTSLCFKISKTYEDLPEDVLTATMHENGEINFITTILYRWLTCTSMVMNNDVCSSIYSQWLVGCFGFNGPLRQYFSLYQAVSQREGEIGEKG